MNYRCRLFGTFSKEVLFLMCYIWNMLSTIILISLRLPFLMYQQPRLSLSELCWNCKHGHNNSFMSYINPLIMEKVSLDVFTVQQRVWHSATNSKSTVLCVCRFYGDFVSQETMGTISEKRKDVIYTLKSTSVYKLVFAVGGGYSSAQLRRLRLK